MTQKIPSFISDINNEMIDAAVHALENEKFILGESVFKFEEEFAKYIGTKNAISVNSGSSALYLSLLAANISNNSKVITSTNSFIASSNTILSTGAEPILVDIDESDGNLDIKNNQTNADAIIPIHIYGNPCDFESVKEFAETKKISPTFGICPNVLWYLGYPKQEKTKKFNDPFFRKGGSKFIVVVA